MRSRFYILWFLDYGPRFDWLGNATRTWQNSKGVAVGDIKVSLGKEPWGLAGRSGTTVATYDR